MQVPWLQAADAEAILRPVVPGCRVAEVVPRPGGEVVRVFEVRLEGQLRPLIVKVYAQRWRWKLAKEVYVYRQLARRGVTGIPRVLHAEPAGVPALPLPFVVLTLLDGEPLSAVAGRLSEAAIGCVYEQMGELLAALHRVRCGRWGYIVTGIYDPKPTNVAYMEAEFAEKLQRFADLGGDPALCEAVAAHALRHADVLAACRTPVLCHNDFHEGNVLVAGEGDRCTLTGCIDVENAVAADPLLDIAKTEYYAIRGDDNRRDALLRGYGPLPTGWPERVAVYRVLHAVDFWNHCAAAGRRAQLPAVAADIETMLRGEPLGPWRSG
ncbi:aminoglycoside phosphotransferase family protein [Dactylosporangium salmoneum]|uniref:Aminoglycoside phosphotransferase domain-containing protein n=1 Tax=Dactylosporangium salmoneum TaxID=53361 RepID=A0ABP5VCH9_9ACTN